MLTRLIEDTDELECANRSSRPAARWAVASLALSMLMPSLDTSIANVGLPTLADAFGATFQQVQWIVLAYLIAVTSLIVVAGRLGDVLGRKRLLLSGIALFTAASLLCGAAPTLWVLIAARAAQGLGAAIMLALTIALVGETVPKSRMGSAMGLLGSMSAIGTTLGPSLGGMLIAGLGWRMIFLVNLPLGVLNFLLALHTLPADRRATRAQSALPRLAMLREPTLSAGLAMSVLVSTVMMATLIVGPFYLARALGLGAARVGLVMSVGPLVAALTGVLAGRVVDRFGARRMTIAGLAGLSGGLAALALAPQRFGVAGYLAAIVVVTAHYALFQTANNTSVMTDVRADERGIVSGMLGLSRNVGLISGASVMGAVFAFASATSDVTIAPPAAVAAGMQGTFLVAVLLALAALAIAMLSRARARRSVLAGIGGVASVMSPAVDDHLPTGAQRSVLKDAALSAAQLSYVPTPRVAVTATFGWARSRDLTSAGDPRLDAFVYDVGAEARAPRSFAAGARTFTPFVGGGVGARSYNYRSLDVGAAHNVAGYGTVDGEVGVSRVHVRLEARDYVTGFKPLTGAGKSATRNDVVIMAGLRFGRTRT